MITSEGRPFHTPWAWWDIPACPRENACPQSYIDKWIKSKFFFLVARIRLSYHIPSVGLQSLNFSNYSVSG